MSDPIWVALITGTVTILGYITKVLISLRNENRRDHKNVTSLLSKLVHGHEHLDNRIAEVREDVRDMRTDVRAVNQRLDNHIHGD